MQPNSSSSPRIRLAAGMTAVESLILLAVLGIIVLIAVPGSAMLIERHRLNTASTDLAAGLFLARAEAQKRASQVTVCPSSDGQSCRQDGDWSQGWLVYSDGNGDGEVQSIELLEAYDAPSRHVRIEAVGAAQSIASFTATGLIQRNGSNRGRFLLCHDDSTSGARAITIDPDGWVSLLPTEGRNCVSG